MTENEHLLRTQLVQLMNSFSSLEGQINSLPEQVVGGGLRSSVSDVKMEIQKSNEVLKQTE